MSTTSDKIRAYFRRFPDADVKKVAHKFNTAVPRIYKLRKEVRGEQPQEEPKREKVTLNAGQFLIAKKLGIDPFEYAKHAAKVEAAKEPEGDSQLGRKFDAGKLDYTLVPFEGLEEIIKVLMFGAQKYDRDNWRHVDNAPQRYAAAAFRHMAAHARGQTTDHETGLSHLAHAGCCVLFLLALEQGEAA